MLYKKKKHQTLNYFVNDVNNQYNNLYNNYFFSISRYRNAKPV